MDGGGGGGRLGGSGGELMRFGTAVSLGNVLRGIFHSPSPQATVAGEAVEDQNNQNNKIAAAAAAASAASSGVQVRVTEKKKEECKRLVVISKALSPQAAKHIEDAQKKGYPKVLTLDRSGASSRRYQSLKGIPTIPGLDRDEYPPATFLEGGSGSSVRHIPLGDNRSAGNQLKTQMNRPSKATDGCKITITTGP